MIRWGVLLALAAVATLLIWLLVPKDEIRPLAPIEGRARGDLLEACNQAAAAAGRPERFSPADVTTRVEEVGAQGGVVALVSVLEARRGGLICRWNGADAATIRSAD